jgi:hypothetical protein
MSLSKPQPFLCPFCGAKMDRPGPMDVQSYEDSDGGRCVCGAAFALDPTSHNLGRAMMDAYCYVAGGPDEALDLDPEKDLDEQVVKGYDSKRHHVMPHKSGTYPGAGGLYFVRLRPEAAERLAKEREKD